MYVFHSFIISNHTITDSECKALKLQSINYTYYLVFMYSNLVPTKKLLVILMIKDTIFDEIFMLVFLLLLTIFLLY